MRLFTTLICFSALFIQACSILVVPPESHLSIPQPSIDETQVVTVEPSWKDPLWKNVGIPSKKLTKYSLSLIEGREVMRAQSQTSASMLRREVSIPARDLEVFRFSWKVNELIKAADIAEKDLDDSPARLVLIFKGDRKKFSSKNAMLSEMAQIISGEPLPYATLMYVWSNKKPSGSVVMNPRTDRIRSIVVESGSKNVGQWLAYERNIRADFEAAFGEPAGDLQSIGIMTDSDNTQSQATTYYGKMLIAKNKQNNAVDLKE